ncbi:MAG: hypothetical protein ABFS34_04815 [Gemmatimonadota bacterium]
MTDPGYNTPRIVNIADFDADTRATFVHLTAEQWRGVIADVPALRVKSVEFDPAQLGGAIEFRRLRGTYGDVLLWAAGAGPFGDDAVFALQEPRLEDGHLFYMPPKEEIPRPPLDTPENEDFKLIPEPPAPCRVGIALGEGGIRFVCRSPDCGTCMPLIVGPRWGGVISCRCMDIVI